MRLTDLQWRWWTFPQCSSWQALPQYQSTLHLEHLLRAASSSCFQPNTWQLAQYRSGAAGRGAAAAIALHSGNYRFVARDMLRLNLEVLKNRHTTLLCYWADKKASSINK